MIDKLIALLLIIFSFAIFIGKSVDLFMFLLVIMLLLKIFFSKKNYGKKIILSITILIIGFNYFLAQKYFIYQLQYLNKEMTIQYAIRLIGLISMFLIFYDKKIIMKIYKYIKKYVNILLGEIIISQIYILYLLVSGKGFSTLWKMKSFIGAYGSAHLYSYSLVIMVIAIEWIYVVKKQKEILLLNVIPLMTSLLTGARAPIIILWCIFILIRFMKNGIRLSVKINYLKLIGIVLVIIALIISWSKIYNLIINSNFIEKFVSTGEGGYVLNGRDIFWKNLIDEFWLQNIVVKLFGNGIYYTVFSNYNTLGWQIWAHSDFLDILISFGFILCSIYMIAYIRFFYKLKINKWFSVIFLMLMLLLSAFNGIVNYSNFIIIVCYIGILVYSINEECSY